MRATGARRSAVNRLVSQVEQAIYDQGLLDPGQGLLVAVSGGLDSMVMLHVLHRLAKKHLWKLTVIHFNHQLRGAESEADQRFVGETAQRLRLPFHTSQGDVRRYQRLRNVSVEMAGRVLRHKFFGETARRLKTGTIALAHHADDQVELFFLRLLRGSGGLALGGMEWVNPSPVYPKLRLVRPLLGLPKSALRAYAAAEAVEFREDASNAQLEAPRNRIRHELLPLLTQHYQPGLTKTILNLMEIIGAEARFVEQTAQHWLQEEEHQDFNRLDAAMQRQIIQLQLLKQDLGARFELIEELRSAAGRQVMVAPERLVFRDKAGKLQLVQLAKSAEFTSESRQFGLSLGKGKVHFGGLELDWELGDCRVPHPKGSAMIFTQAGGHEMFDAERVGERVTLRHWRPGDRFQPIGMSQPIKLQDWFVNQKVPRDRRRQLVLAESSPGGIFWVEGLRIGELFKLDKQSKRCLSWHWRRIGMPW